MTRSRGLVLGALLVLGTSLTACAPFSGEPELDRRPDSTDWARRQRFEDNQAAIEGARIFAVAGCMQCHTYLGHGVASVGAPDLSTIGRTGRRASWFAAYVANPARFGNEVMPRFEGLGKENLRRLGSFLEASKGG